MRSLRATCFYVSLAACTTVAVWADRLSELAAGELLGIALWCVVVMVWLDLHLWRVEREIRELEAGIARNGRDRAESSPGRCGK